MSRRWVFALLGLLSGCFPTYEIATADGGQGAPEASGGQDARTDGQPEAGADAGACSAPFPSTPILDTFATSGPLGSSWVVQNAGAYSVQAGEVIAVTDGGLVNPGTITWATAFGATQEAYVTVDHYDQSAPQEEIELLLKCQVTASESNSIYVDYTDLQLPRGVYVGYSTAGGTFNRVGSVTYTLKPGDQLGARACADGHVQIYVNGTLLQTFDVSAFPAAKLTGYVSLFTGQVLPPLAISHFGGG